MTKQREHVVYKVDIDQKTVQGPWQMPSEMYYNAGNIQTSPSRYPGVVALKEPGTALVSLGQRPKYGEYDTDRGVSVVLLDLETGQFAQKIYDLFPEMRTSDVYATFDGTKLLGVVWYEITSSKKDHGFVLDLQTEAISPMTFEVVGTDTKYLDEQERLLLLGGSNVRGLYVVDLDSGEVLNNFPVLELGFFTHVLLLPGHRAAIIHTANDASYLTVMDLDNGEYLAAAELPYSTSTGAVLNQAGTKLYVAHMYAVSEVEIPPR